jgi:hypothetical protein
MVNISPRLRYTSKWGRPGFDVGCEALGACRGDNYPRKKSYKFILANRKRKIANDRNFANREVAIAA